MRKFVVVTNHGDVEGVEEVEGQGRDQVHKEPGGAVVKVDGAAVVDHLTRLTHVGGAEIQDDVWKGAEKKEGFYF